MVRGLNLAPGGDLLSHFRSTIGAGGLYFRVRDGNGCGPSAIATRKSHSLKTTQAIFQACIRSSPRPISTGRLNALLHLHPRPINQLILLGSYLVNPVGNLILRSASRLDAFSAYPFRHNCSGASGETTGTSGLSIPVLSY